MKPFHYFAGYGHGRISITLGYYVLTLQSTKHHVISLVGSLDARCLEVLPQYHDFRKHNQPTPNLESVLALIEAEFFSFGYFENLFHGCTGNTARKESDLSRELICECVLPMRRSVVLILYSQAFCINQKGE